MEPSDLYRAFQWDFLKIVGQIAYDRALWVAKNAIDDDSRCGVGYGRWDLIKAEITKQAASLYRDWLSTPDSGASFVFAIKGIPCRFYRGDADAPVPDKYKKPTATELVQFELLRGTDSQVPADLVFRLLVVADYRGRYPLAVHFLAANAAGDVVNCWEIPVDRRIDDLDSGPPPVTPIVTPKPPVVLPPLKIEVTAEMEEEAYREYYERTEKERKQREADDRKRGA